MKRSSECAVSPLLSKPSGKAPRRQKGSPAAAGRAKSAASKGNAGTKRGGIRISSKASEHEPQHSPSAPSFSVSEEMMAVAEWMDWQAELGDLWRSLYWVEEEKLSGWFPFVDEDFLRSDNQKLGKSACHVCVCFFRAATSSRSLMSCYFISVSDSLHPSLNFDVKKKFQLPAVPATVVLVICSDLWRLRTLVLMTIIFILLLPFPGNADLCDDGCCLCFVTIRIVS
ncbi:hypothetical protein ZIOFF_040216 [Zingiber officinale]|uniref:Uncharacterized protein n=1 Tax=Zingiber officinale TaxID=94328 RepID=A0A8J5G5X7_ZINOF|nr:hypothetical protein ZIOFF_040216 [Zingiber officinale]